MGLGPFRVQGIFLSFLQLTLFTVCRHEKKQQKLSSVRVCLFRKKVNFSEGGSCTREPYICIRSQFATDLLMHGQKISYGADNFRQSHGQPYRGPRFSSYRVVAEKSSKFAKLQNSLRSPHFDLNYGEKKTPMKLGSTCVSISNIMHKFNFILFKQ